MSNWAEESIAIPQRWNDIAKSREDKREYRGLTLENKLKILLISDPKTDKSAAALEVNVGSMSEPDELPGLAHFCEHMLFLGTQKFPEENEYQKYLTAHGGCSNAYTAMDHTKYFFDVMPEHFSGAMDRFAQFFTGPLFTESATSREVNAVNSEHEKNVSSDAWRLLQVERYLSKHGHPYRKFATGNLETLHDRPKELGIDVRARLLEFHEEWYSANTMTLAVLGRESLDELEEMVSGHFSAVLNKNVVAPEWLDHPMGPDQMRQHVQVVPIKDIRQMAIAFPVPDMHDYYKASPLGYISHLVGHEGPGSLLSALKERGWCNNLSSGPRTPGKGFSTFNIDVDLTIEGLDHVHDIVTLIFQYLNRVRAEGLHEWIFNESSQLQKMQFQFKDKEKPMKYVSGLSSALRYYPLHEILTGPYFTTDWRPDLVTQMLDLLVPSRIGIAVVSQSLVPVCDLVEPRYGTKYKIERIADLFIQKWENCGLCDELQIPKPNEFIPTNFNIVPSDDNKSKNPTVVFSSEISRAWFKQDETFLLPKAVVMFEVQSPVSDIDPMNRCLTFLYGELVKDDLKEYSYDAELAGLSWSLNIGKCGFTVTASGYNDKLTVLLEKILDKMVTFSPNEKRFEIIKEAYTRSLRNFNLKQPYEQSTTYLGSLMSETAWTREELLEVTPRVTPLALKLFTAGLLASVHVESLVYGNLTRTAAVALGTTIEDKLKTRGPLIPLRPRQLLRGRQVQLEDGSHYVYEARNNTHKSSCTTTYFQCGMQNTQANTLLELLTQITSEPCFNQLRTKEQLGYIVFCYPKRDAGVQGITFTLQSEKHPEYLSLRVEAFLVQLREMIVDMSEDEFETHKEALAANRLEKPKNLHDQAKLYWTEIGSRQYHFDRVEVEVPYLRTITKEQLVEYFDTYIAASAPRRHQLSIYVVSDAEGGAGEMENENWCQFIPEDCRPPPTTLITAKKIDDVTGFKSSHSLYPLAQPYIDIPGQTKSKL